MAYEQRAAHALYKKLLGLYPRAFRERLGETMEQTFHDLYNERKKQGKGGWFGFTVWMFSETAMGIAREYLLLMTKGDAMKNMLMTFRSPALISLLLVIPFMIMELVNRRDLNTEFPVPLFVILWLLPVIFILTAAPIVKNLRRTGNSIVAHPIGLVIRVVVLAFVVWMWFGIVIDQIPCFLGVPNCD